MYRVSYLRGILQGLTYTEHIIASLYAHVVRYFSYYPVVVVWDWYYHRKLRRYKESVLNGRIPPRKSRRQCACTYGRYSVLSILHVYLYRI